MSRHELLGELQSQRLVETGEGSRRLRSQLRRAQAMIPETARALHERIRRPAAAAFMRVGFANLLRIAREGALATPDDRLHVLLKQLKDALAKVVFGARSVGRSVVGGELALRTTRGSDDEGAKKQRESDRTMWDEEQQW